LIQIQVSNTFERLNYFNSLTANQKRQAVAGSQDEIVSLLKTTDTFQKLNNQNNLNPFSQQKKPAFDKRPQNVKTIADKNFINRLSDLLERYNDDEDEEKERKRRPVYQFVDDENEENIYPEKVKATSFAQKYRNSIPGQPLKILSDSSIMEKSDIVKQKQPKKASINEPSVDQLVAEMKGSNAEQISTHLLEFYDCPPSQIARGLKKGGFAVDDIANTLFKTFKANAEEISADLKFAGFNASQVTAVLKKYYEKSPGHKGPELISGIARNLFSAGFNAGETAEEIKNIFKQGARETAVSLSRGGFNPEDTMFVMKNLFHLPVEKISGIFSEIFRLEKNQAKILLEKAGYPALLIQNSLDKVFRGQLKNRPLIK
jgi:hypothetical protein